MENELKTAKSIHPLVNEVAKAAWETPTVSPEDSKPLESSGYKEILKRWEDAVIIGSGFVGGTTAAFLTGRLTPNPYYMLTAFVLGFEVTRQMAQSLIRKKP